MAAAPLAPPVAVPDGHPDQPTPADDGVDVTLIRWMLSLSPGERLNVLQGFVDSVAELTGAGTRA